jgi:hypothetical protein
MSTKLYLKALKEGDFYFPGYTSNRSQVHYLENYKAQHSVFY